MSSSGSSSSDLVLRPTALSSQASSSTRPPPMQTSAPAQTPPFVAAPDGAATSAVVGTESVAPTPVAPADSVETNPIPMQPEGPTPLQTHEPAAPPQRDSLTVDATTTEHGDAATLTLGDDESADDACAGASASASAGAGAGAGAGSGSSSDSSSDAGGDGSDAPAHAARATDSTTATTRTTAAATTTTTTVAPASSTGSAGAPSGTLGAPGMSVSSARLARVVGSSRVSSATATPTPAATASMGFETPSASSAALFDGAPPSGDMVILHVSTVDGDKKALRVPADSTVGTVKEEFARKISLAQAALFELCISTTDGDAFLDAAAPLSSLVLPVDRTLFLKVKFWKEPRSLSDPVAIQKIYRQIQRNVVHGTWQAPEAFAMRLASYHVRSAFGEFQSRSHTLAFLRDLDLGQFLPPWMVESMPSSYYHNRLCRMHEKLVGQFSEDVQAAKRFIDVSRQLPSYGLTLFSVKDARAQACRLAVAEDGVFVSPGLDLPALSMDAFYPYSAWREWHAEPNMIGFTIVVARSNANRAYTEEEIQAETQSLKFIASASQTEAIMNLCTDYYRLMVVLSERTDDARTARLERVSLDARFGLSLPPGDSFLPFARRKPTAGRWHSRLELFKHFLTLRFRTAGLHPVVKLWLDVDNALDNNRWLDTLDLSSTGIDSNVLGALGLALVDTFSFADTTVDGAAAALIENYPLAHLLLADNAISAVSMAAFDESLRALLAVHPRIRSIDLSVNAALSNKGIASLVESFKAASFLVTLSLARSDCGNKGAFAIFSGLAGSSAIANVILAGNRLTDDRDWPVALRDMLTKCPSLAFLDLSSNRFGDAAADSIVTGLMMSQSLRRLDLSDNKLTSKSLKKLVTYLHANRGLQYLAIGGGKADIGDDLGRAIDLSSSLVELSLNQCMLGRNLSPIFEALVRKTQTQVLLTLNLDGTGLSEGRTVEELAAALAVNPSLTSLSLRDNKLGGRLILGPALAQNKNLINLNLGANGLKASDISAMAEGLARNTTLRVLVLDSNGLGNHGFEATCNLLQTNRGISSLNFDRNKVADKGMILLNVALGHNPALHVLSLRENSITIKGFERILDSFRGNTALRELHLEGNSLREAASMGDRVNSCAPACNVFI